VDPESVEAAITPQTILITIMHANNEVGTVQPISRISQVARSRRIFMHTDAAQSVGKIPTHVNELGVDLLSVAGHKLYAPKGVGALFVRRGVTLEKLMHGADHEQDMRAGTENVPGIVGLGKACEVAGRDLMKHMEHMRRMRQRLHDGLQRELTEMKLNGHPTEVLPNTLSVGFPGLDATTILSETEGVAASAGAACHSDSVDISSVLSAMGVPLEYAIGTVRFSTGRMTTEAEIDRAIEIVTKAVKGLSSTIPAVTSARTDPASIKLTHFTHGLGCACKLRPQALEKILKDLPLPKDPRILVGTNTADDAAVYLLDEKTALVQTVDFFTPIVDDPYHFGSIAAANALSDIYAMGGKPLFALNVVGFPSNRLPLEVLERILEGAQEKAEEAGISIVGGHTIDDTEPKYGMVVLGVVAPDRILTNANAQPGDGIILTKPLGVGIISTAIKRGLAGQQIVRRAIDIMSQLNRGAAEVLAGFPVHACTDITGFGFLGHLKEMCQASGVDAEVYLDEIPSIDEAWEFATGSIVPGGTLHNVEYVSDSVEWGEGISRTAKIILCDAQTSGGLLISVPARKSEELLTALHQNGVTDSAAVGTFTEKGKGRIAVRRSR